MPIDPIRRLVRFADEDLESVPMMVRAETLTLVPGMVVQVEVGARWTLDHGHAVRVDGQWVACEVVTDGKRDLVVSILPGARTNGSA
jgi:hypothetical protein